MKCMHLGDIHLGKTLFEYDLCEDQAYILKEIISLALSEKVDAVLIAGDVYDRANPGDGAMNLLSAFLEEFAAKKIPVYLISGNHDSDDKINYASRLLESLGIHIYSVFDGTLHKHVLEDADGIVNVYLLPFIKASQVRSFYPEEEIDTYEDAVRVVIEKANIDTTQRNILVAHQFVAGRSESEAPKLSGSESPAVKNVGNVERIGYDLFDAFDYVALGHIHSPQKIGRETIRYAGSPLKYSLSESMDAKSVPIVTLGGDVEVSIQLCPLTPLRDLRHITGRKEALLRKENIVDADDYMYVTLTDEEIIDDAIGIFRQYYPNTIRVDYDNRHTSISDEVLMDEWTDHPSFTSLIQDFYQQMYGLEISEEELSIMKEAAREAGVADETD